MMQASDDEMYMRQALEQARLGIEKGEVPVGAVATLGGNILARAHNSPIQLQDPTAHAEILVLRAAARQLANYRLPDITLYVSLEPCAMCYVAMVHARIQRLVFGAHDPKTGVVSGVHSIQDAPFLNHRIDVSGGVLEQECADLLSAFFAGKRV